MTDVRFGGTVRCPCKGDDMLVILSCRCFFVDRWVAAFGSAQGQPFGCSVGAPLVGSRYRLLNSEMKNECFPKALLPRRGERRYRRAMFVLRSGNLPAIKNGMELYNIRAEALVYP